MSWGGYTYDMYLFDVYTDRYNKRYYPYWWTSSRAPVWSRYASENYWPNYYAKARRSLDNGSQHYTSTTQTYTLPSHQHGLQWGRHNQTYNFGKDKGDLVSSDYGKFYQGHGEVPGPPALSYQGPPAPVLHSNYDYTNVPYHKAGGNYGNEQKALPDYRYYRDRDKQGHGGFARN